MALDKVIDNIKSKVSPDVSDADIVELILEDHRPLKEFIKIMKDDEQPEERRREAAENFAIQLVAHAKPEERVLYTAMKTNEELRAEAFEGDAEHQLADQMLEEIKRTTDKDAWSAKVKVVAELVEHHIEEEESEILPDVKKQMKLSERERMGAAFLDEKSKMLEEGADDAPPESTPGMH